jgi:hypothetical protein
MKSPNDAFLRMYPCHLSDAWLYKNNSNEVILQNKKKAKILINTM